MAVIAVDAVVHIPVDLWVLKIVRVVASVAPCALELRIVTRNQVARCALAICVAMVDGELCVVRVNEPRRRDPCARRMAVGARCREDKGIRRRGVRWIAGVVVIRLMTSDASGGQGRVIAGGVAVAAVGRRHHMQSRQREGSIVVIEGGIGPVIGVMTEFACGRESRGQMGRTIGAGIVLLVTRIAQCAVEGVVVVDMAISTDARRHRVLPRQLEAGTGMVERTIGP